jgi:hypothetical protein
VVKRSKLVAAVVAAVVSIGGAAHAGLVDFSAGPTGSQAEGFSATGAPELAFTSATGSGFIVGSFGAQSVGNGLFVLGDGDGNYLKGLFSTSQTALSLDFGNDDPHFTIPGDLATLRVFLGASFVGQTTVSLNRDDIMNQTISFAGASFDNFTFAYTNAAGSPFTGPGDIAGGLAEVVDNIAYSSAGVGVPEPATWAMMLLGFGAIGALVRRRAAPVGASL